MMSLYQPEPVEISTRMRPGEWTEETLEALVVSYQQRIVEMGASITDVVTDIDRSDDGSVRVAVSWVIPATAGD
jgi:hypothetical protein